MDAAPYKKWHSPMAKRRWPESRNFSKDIDQQTCYILMVEDALAGVGVLCSEIDPTYEAILMVLGNLIPKLRIQQFTVLL